MTFTIRHFMLAIVAIHLPLSAVSMETKNGYLCNLCHSLENDHPYPPPAAEDKIVRFTKSENEKFGSPFDRGVTCLEVWNTVLDYANPNVKDEASCRRMALAYAPQCCNDINDESKDDFAEHREESEPYQNNGRLLVTAERTRKTPLFEMRTRLHQSTMGTGGDEIADAQVFSFTPESQDTVDRDSHRISNSTMASGRGDGIIADTFFTTQQPPASERDRVGDSSMASGRGNDNGRRAASTSYLRGKA